MPPKTSPGGGEPRRKPRPSAATHRRATPPPLPSFTYPPPTPVLHLHTLRPIMSSPPVESAKARPRPEASVDQWESGGAWPSRGGDGAEAGTAQSLAGRRRERIVAVTGGRAGGGAYRSPVPGLGLDSRSRFPVEIPGSRSRRGFRRVLRFSVFPPFPTRVPPVAVSLGRFGVLTVSQNKKIRDKKTPKP